MNLHRFTYILRKIEQAVEQYVSYRPTPLNLKSLVDFGETSPASKSFLFLRTELPVRLANTMQEIRLLPERLLRTESVLNIAELYHNSFATLMKYEKCDSSRQSVISEFTDDLSTLIQKHTDVVAQMAMGIKQFPGQFSMEEDMQLHYFLDRFYISRIGIRMLIRQHILIYGPNLCENPHHVGAIDPECSPLRTAITAYAYARSLCMRTFGRAPGATMETIDRIFDPWATHQIPELKASVDKNGNITGSPLLFRQQPKLADLSIHGHDFTFCYVPGHLFHVLYELTKNAMRAVVEHTPDGTELPKLQFLITSAPEDITIRLSDEGGGMARHLALQAFKYTFTTASHLPPEVQLDKNGETAKGALCSPDFERATFSPLAGRGHGLPLSRLYARYLSGDLVFLSTEGHGSSAYIYLKRRPDQAFELIPIFNHTSRAVYQRDSLLDADWISGAQLRNGQLFTHSPGPH